MLVIAVTVISVRNALTLQTIVQSEWRSYTSCLKSFWPNKNCLTQPFQKQLKIRSPLWTFNILISETAPTNYYLYYLWIITRNFLTLKNLVRDREAFLKYQCSNFFKSSNSQFWNVQMRNTIITHYNSLIGIRIHMRHLF